MYLERSKICHIWLIAEMKPVIIVSQVFFSWQEEKATIDVHM